eukprot:2378151-Rhodomonas_salina.1
MHPVRPPSRATQPTRQRSLSVPQHCISFHPSETVSESKRKRNFIGTLPSLSPTPPCPHSGF